LLRFGEGSCSLIVGSTSATLADVGSTTSR
jgi:hypothetical protein